MGKAYKPPNTPLELYMEKYVSYLRVSTKQQGQSGLGLEAQRESVRGFISGCGGEHLREFQEVESGGKNTRPILAEALKMCRLTGATLIVAKLDRLGRNAAFLLSLRDAGVKFVCVDNPTMNTLTVGILAVVAQAEREMISARVKAALQAAKARGTRLGNPLGATLIPRGIGAEALKRQSCAFNGLILPVIEEIRQQGITTLAGIARELNRRNIQTMRGKKFYATTVRNILKYS